MLKSEPGGALKKRPLGRPLIKGVLKKSSSPVQTAKALKKLEAFLFLAKKTFNKIEGFVLEVGIEPTLQRNWILNPARLPVPPLEH